MWTVMGAVLLLVLAACGSKAPEVATVALEPVTSMGTNPFTPSVGAGQAVTPVARAGGTVPGDTVGLFGGTQQIASCDPHKLVAFLRAHPDKAAAWAGVVGIRAADIPAFVATLTPVILRSDTSVTNHGFVAGHATAFAAVLQAGTAVLVDRHGDPVTRCACGNPLTTPSLFTKAHFVGPTWARFTTTSVTVIRPVTVIINSFTLVEPNTGAAFQRPAGTQGHRDSPAVNPPHPSATSAPPPATSAPAATSASPATSAPPARSPSTTPSARPAPSRSASPSVKARPSLSPPPPLSASPSVKHRPSPSAPPAAPKPPTPKTTAAPETASWAIGTCFVDRRTTPPTFTGALNVRNDGPSRRHSYRVTVAFGASGIARTVPVRNVEAGQTVSATVSTPGPPHVTAPTVPCEITRLVDEKGKTPGEGIAIPAPPDNSPPVNSPTVEGS
jgi:hypothetical protein